MKSFRIFAYLFAFVGFALLFGAAVQYQNARSFLHRAVETKGTVIDFDTDDEGDDGDTLYHPIVNFVDKHGTTIRFTSPSGSHPPSYATGEEVKVLYLENRPENALINDFSSLWGASSITAFLGTAFSIVGCGIIFFLASINRKNEYLRRHGIRIKTDFMRIEEDETVSVNDKYPYRIVSRWLDPETKQIHFFKSEYLWSDPSSYMNVDKITVMIERGNPKKHLMDVSFLPKLAR